MAKGLNTCSAATVSADATTTRARQIVRLIRQHGPMSRSQLHELTGIHPNLIGDAAGWLIGEGLVRDAEPAIAQKAGRPQTLLEIDPNARRCVGVSISPEGVSIASMRLNGESTASGGCESAAAFAKRPERYLKPVAGDDVLAIAISCTGFVDAVTRQILFSSVAQAGGAVSLSRAFDAAHELMPRAAVRLTNDMHALSTSYVLQNVSAGTGDTLLIGLEDGQIGASVLHEGRPSRGCVLAANELGHTRLAVKTPRCYCGAVGCVERVFSSAWLAMQGEAASIAESLGERKLSGAMSACLDFTAQAIANAANFLRPHRIVLASPLATHRLLTDGLSSRIAKQLLPVLRERVAIDWWTLPTIQSAHVAAWAGLSGWLLGENDA